MIDEELVKNVDLLAKPSDIIASINPEMLHSLDHEYVIRQAQERLKGRSKSELEAGVRYAGQLVESAEGMAQWVGQTKMRQGAEQVFMNDPISFIELFEHFDVHEQDDFPNATPITYFALIAFLYALESLKAYSAPSVQSGANADNSYDHILQEHSERFAGERLTEAREMIAFILGMEFEAVFRRKRAKRANKAKNQDYSELKKRIFEFVDTECDGLSNRKAAIAAASRFETEISGVSRSDDPEHQIAKWIGEHRKGNR
ncbi:MULTISPECIES: hypothetical protein [Marinobacter]|uniref:hypothetical protein n=1 Tax=Marinobacter TaxID=2742 RepID=UPI001247B345|nr:MULTISPECIES: hypothetical protein [Marinobacter]MBL3556876.1 hypothetical protein [Marinobacter sp. JB05H06]